MTDRDESILKHVGKYGVTLRVVLEELFFDGKTCDHVLSRLTSGEKAPLKTIKIGKTKLHYYQLTVPEARSRSIPEHRGRTKGGTALRVAIQVLWFCCMSGLKRTRIDRRKLARQLGRGKGFGRPHVAELREGNEQGVLYRVYCPGPDARPDYLLKSLNDDYEKGLENEKLAEWIREGSFGFAVLVETEKRKQKLEQLIRDLGPTGVITIVEVVPGLRTLATAVNCVVTARKQSKEISSESGN